VGRRWGAIVVGTLGEEPLPPATESRLAQFTELMATAIANAEARGEVERLATEQAALRRVATMVARGRPAEDVFAKVAQEVAQLLGLEVATVRRFEPDGWGTIVGRSGDLGDAYRVGARIKQEGESVTTVVYRTGRSARFDDYERAGSIPADARQLGLRAAVASPIVVNGRVWGAIAAGTSRAEPMPANAESRIADFTELVAAAISNVQARSDLAASRVRIVAAADEERRRVVRDLHDGAQQRLVHTVVTLTLAQRALHASDDEAASLVGEALEHAQQGNTELRELAHGILPAALTNGGLKAGIDAVLKRLDLPVRLDVPADRFPPEIEASAYFIVAEALTNVVKHAHAEHAEVRASVEDRTLRVEIRDDGIGGADPDGHGLLGMGDRVTALGGRLDIDSPPGGGTVLAAMLPLPGE
jgi:signal transduction histidine kinase